ncbi:tetratricopeptide repeat protein [Amycolatopsis sp. NBC_00345]|uniref:tetratricopeptide repeat protein n=1 Tax=Amycolatopsis sp. NBC_00345 TaxID=2975955 RepID=UPI002E268158
MEVSASIREALTRLALDTPLRRGIDRVSASRQGGLFVLGFDDVVAAVCRDGYEVVDARVSPESVSQLSKPDLAMILTADATTILRINTELAPRSTHRVQGRGARHLAAAAMARDVPYPVVAVSEETGAITVFLGEEAHELSERPMLKCRAILAVLSLDEEVQALALLPTETAQAPEAAVRVERARRSIVDAEVCLLELGAEGGQLDDLLSAYCAKLGWDRFPDRAHVVPHGVPLLHMVAEELDRWHEQALLAADGMLAERRGQSAVEPDRAFPRMSFDDEREAVRWYDQTAAQLLGTIRWAASHGDEKKALRWSLALVEYFHRRKPWDQWIDVLSLAVLAARQQSDLRAEASVLTSLGIAQRELGQAELAYQLWDQALEAWRELGDRLGEAEVLNHRAYALDEAGDPAAALRCAQEALTLLDLEDARRLRGKVLNNLSGIHCRLGECDQAAELAKLAMQAFDESGYRHGHAWALSNQGNAHRDAGRHTTALDCYRTALDARLEIEDHYGVAVTRADLGHALLAAGDVDDARAQLRQAESYFRGLGDRRAEALGVTLERLAAR